VVVYWDEVCLTELSCWYDPSVLDLRFGLYAGQSTVSVLKPEVGFSELECWLLVSLCCSEGFMALRPTGNVITYVLTRHG
jgi:hypothetical protein